MQPHDVVALDNSGVDLCSFRVRQFDINDKIEECSVLDYLKVTWQNLKEILLVALPGTLLVMIFALIGGGLGYLLAAHPTIWIRSIVVALMIICFTFYIMKREGNLI